MKKIILNQKTDSRVIKELETCAQFICFGEPKEKTLSSKILLLALFLFIILPLIIVISASMTLGVAVVADYFLNLNRMYSKIYIEQSLYFICGFITILIAINVWVRMFKDKYQLDKDEVFVVIKDDKVPINNRTYIVHDFLLEDIKAHYKS